MTTDPWQTGTQRGFRPFDSRGGRAFNETPQETLVLDSWRHRAIDTRAAQGVHFPPRINSSLPFEGDKPLSLQKSLAEPSWRRRDAIKSAFRRLDPSGRGTVTTQELTRVLQQCSKLSAREQEGLVRDLGAAQAGCGSPSGEDRSSITLAAFATYYQQRGRTVERDVDFEKLLHQHFGFPGVSDILEDMKNNFAAVGLACACSQAQAQSQASPGALSLEAFQDALGAIGMHYSRADVERVFEAFASLQGSAAGHSQGGQGGATAAGVLEVARLTDHLVSAPRPETPLFQDTSPGSLTIPSTPAAPAPLALGQGSAATGGASTNTGGSQSFPAPPPAPPEPEPGATGLPGGPEEYLQPPSAPPEVGSEEDGPQAPPEPDSDGRRPLEPTPEAPPEEDDGQPPPAEPFSEEPRCEPPLAPEEHYTPSSPQAQSTLSPTAGQVTSPTAAAGRSSKRAVTVGINYIGLHCRLSGCINDSNTFISLLEEEFGYEVANIRQLRDDMPRAMPTRKNILVALQWLTSGAAAGDHLFFHFSGHGSQRADTDGDEQDGRDEVLVPCDYRTSGMITDDELRRVLVSSLPEGVRLTVVFDCCHSGTALDLPYKVKLKNGDAVDIHKRQPRQLNRGSPASIVMISGCRDDQTSADISAGAAGNTQPAGAMTTAFRSVISKKKDASYHTLIAEMRRFLRSHRFTQVPQLSSEHFLDLTACFMPEQQPPEPAGAGLSAEPSRPAVRKALTIGINYLNLPPGRGQLSGCIHDSDSVVAILKSTFSYQDSQICRLRDDDPRAMPTRANMLAAFRWLVDGASAGDEMFFHYSGHGGRRRDTSGDEWGGRDDTIIPCDFQSAGQILDDDLREHLVERLPVGCVMWVMLDCSHSGTALDLKFNIQASQDGRSMQCTKSKSRRRGSGANGDIIMIAACKDTETAGVHGGSRAAGAMTAAFRHSITPSITCEDLMLAMRSFLKRNGYSQTPQMSSERFLRLDKSFVKYGEKAQAAQTVSSSSLASPAAAAQTQSSTASTAVPERPPQSQGHCQKRAVTVGINYIGMAAKLAGCINDSDTFIELLTQDFGFKVSDIRQLRDDTPQAKPTRKNMLVAMQWLASGAKEGDHLFFHYSGHGSQQTDAGGDEMDGRDETLVPCDYQTAGMLSDDELRRVLIAGLPKGVRLTVILDCCHSGTGMDLPYKVVLQGDTVSIKKKLPHQMPRPSKADVVMISGCRDDQTSADIGAGSLGNSEAAGAMTTAFKKVISKRNDISFHSLISEMRKYLRQHRFTQVPQLSSEQYLDLTAAFMPEHEVLEPEPAKPLRPAVRKALTIGINYLTLPPGRGRLSGCINDSDTIMAVLRSTFHFQESQICRLRDDDPRAMPTKANMLAAFHWLTEGAAPGDEMFLHFSGHGSQRRDTSGDEWSGKDNTLLPSDFQTSGQIVDDDLYKHLVEDLPKGCRLWVVMDCCHSGTALDLRFKMQLARDGRSLLCKKCASRRRVTGKDPTKADVIMISGCKDTQTSADIQAGSMGADAAAGAMTTAFHQAISPTISCEDLIATMRHLLKRNGYRQVPQMSSEQFLQLDSPFVGYARKVKNSRGIRTTMAPAAPAATNPSELQERINSLQDQIAQLQSQQHVRLMGETAEKQQLLEENLTSKIAPPSWLPPGPPMLAGLETF